MDIKHAFAVLREQLGPDRACARYIGITPQHYEALRNGRAKIPPRTADYICLKAAQIESRHMPANPAEGKALCPDSRPKN